MPLGVFSIFMCVLIVGKTVRSRWTPDEESRVLWTRDGPPSERAFGWKQHSSGDQDTEAVTRGFERLGHIWALPIRNDPFWVNRVMQNRTIKGNVALFGPMSTSVYL